MTATMRTPAKGLKGAAALLVATCLIGIVLMFLARPADVLKVASDWEVDLFMDAALDAADISDAPFASVLDLLDQAGFDGRALAAELLVAGVPAAALALPNVSSFGLSGEQQEQRLCLAQAIYYESRNQPVIGRIAVADVVLNRVEDRRFPETICGVVFHGQGSAKGCQFSFACDGSMNRAREPEAWDEAERLADLIYRGFRPPLTGFATFYHAEYATPYWARAFDETRMIGDHVFYRPPGAIELAASELGLDLAALFSS